MHRIITATLVPSLMFASAATGAPLAASSSPEQPSPSSHNSSFVLGGADKDWKLERIMAPASLNDTMSAQSIVPAKVAADKQQRPANHRPLVLVGGALVLGLAAALLLRQSGHRDRSRCLIPEGC